jgi:inner membrane protein
MDLFGVDLTHMLYWHWFAFSSVFFVLEVLTMGFFFLWFGVSAVFVGLLLLIFPQMGWELQLLVWALMAVYDVAGWRFVFRPQGEKGSEKAEAPLLNRRAEQYVGRVFTLEGAIENGYGKVKVDDTHWSAQSDRDLPAGTKVKVVAVKGTVLVVEAV